MYKIQFLFVMLLWGLGITYAQQPNQRWISSTRHRAKTIVLSKFLSDLVYTTKSRQPTVFTGHRLADRVDLSKKHALDAIIGDQQASLSCLIPYQIPFQ